VIYVPDTHALVWYLTADRRLGNGARSAFVSVDNGPDHAIVPVMVLAEMMYLEEKGRIRIDLAKLITDLQGKENYSIASLTLEMVLAAKRLPEVPELFDRMIAATALVNDAILVTRDPVFDDLKAVKTVW
jgi:PIN domain nuclease of toxin-antitoxin system